MKYIFCFSAPAGIMPVFARYKESGPLKFIRTDMRASPDWPIYLKASDIPHPGISTDETDERLDIR